MNYEDYIIDAIETVVNKRLKEIRFNYYIEGKILTDNGDGTYDVEYNQQTLSSVKARSGLILAVGNIVFICVVNGDFSNKFIDCVRP